MDKDLSIEEYEKLNPTISLKWKGKDIIFCVPNKLTLWRVDSLMLKEPETIAWIDSFSSTDIFVDIGANVGMYSIWAAATSGVQVFSFEPESLNFSLLNKNILANALHNQIIGYCIALSNETNVGNLYLSDFLIGTSGHTFGQNLDSNLKVRNTAIRQGCVSMTLDELVSNKIIPCPNYIKVDVDGLEHKVVDGSLQILKNNNVKSILIELNTNLDEHLSIIKILQKLGFKYSKKQVLKAMRKEGPFKGVANHIFSR